MAQAAWPSAPNPSASTFLPAAVPTARRSAAPPRGARAKDAPRPSSSGDRGHSGQGKRAPEHVTHRSLGGTYSKPDARVKLIPAEEITYVRHVKPFSRSGSAGLQKRECKRSVTPPPSSRSVSLVRSTLLTRKPTTPAPPVASSLSPKSFETTQNRKTVSLNRPSPLYKAVQRSDPLSFRSAHVNTNSCKVPLGTRAEPFSKSVSTLDDRKLSSMNNWATLKCQRTRSDVDSIVQKEPTAELSLLIPTSVLNIRSADVCRDTTSSPSSSLNLLAGKRKLVSLQPETNVPPTQSAQSTTPAQRVERSNYFEAVPSTKNHISNERQKDQEASVNCNMSSGTEIAEGKSCQDAHTNCAVSFTQAPPVILQAELHKKPYQPEACWKGKFEVIGGLTHTCDGLEAHFPLEARFPEIFIKVYEASKKMPETLKLEALPLSCLLPKMFKIEPPDGHDIGLCFISSLQRPNRNFDHLMENISSDIGLRTDIGTSELLIFSSKLLTKEDQTKHGKFYCWGVFWKHLRKKRQRFNNHTNNVEISNACLSNGHSHDVGRDLDLTEDKETESSKCEIGLEVDAIKLSTIEKSKPKKIGKMSDMSGEEQAKIVKREKSDIKLDLTRDKDTNRIKKCMTMLKTHDSNAMITSVTPAVSFFTGSCSPDSTDNFFFAYSPCKSATRAPAFQDCVLVSPPGFPLDIPPGFTKAHCGFRTGETAESCIDSSSSLVLDTGGITFDIPPGFTAAHRGLTATSPGLENDVSTVFSEKKPPIKFSLTRTRPVHTNVPLGFAKFLEVKKEPELPAVCKATENITLIGKVNEMEIHDKVNMEVDDSSEEREFPKTKQLSDILVRSSASSANNATTSEPPATAASSKKLRLNGRIVLNR